MRIIIIRHGETELNRAEVFRGQLDIELNGTGRRQAELLGEYLSRTPIEAVYSSPLKRALETARAVSARHNLEVKPCPELNDLHMGEWQGLTRAQVESKYKEAYDLWLSHPEKLKMPGGESLSDVRKRLLTLIDNVTARHTGVVVLAAHRVVCKVLACVLLGLDDSHFWNIEHSNCGVTTFVLKDGRFILTGHNNTSFLQPLQKKPLGDF